MGDVGVVTKRSCLNCRESLPAAASLRPLLLPSGGATRLLIIGERHQRLAETPVGGHRRHRHRQTNEERRENGVVRRGARHRLRRPARIHPRHVEEARAPRESQTHSAHFDPRSRNHWFLLSGSFSGILLGILGILGILWVPFRN